VAGGVVGIATFVENPARAIEGFAEGEEIGSNILMSAREAFLAGGEEVHQEEAEVGFAGGEVDGREFVLTEMVDGFPTDLAAKAGFIAATLDAWEVAQEGEQDVLRKCQSVRGKEIPTSNIQKGSNG
jgi:hypothetical protein